MDNFDLDWGTIADINDFLQGENDINIREMIGNFVFHIY